MRRFIPILFLLALGACASQKKIEALRTGTVAATLALPLDAAGSELPSRTISQERDTMTVRDENGKEIIIMKAVRDENGEMVASDVIEAATVTARFRNLAERHGLIDLKFQVIVPESMQDSRWQLRFHPRMWILDDSLSLDAVVITGKEYRKAQLKGYEQYSRFISSIVSDTTSFINLRRLEIFLKRNLPQIYAFRSDSTAVSDEEFSSAFGVTEQEAIRHYTDMYAKRRNLRKIRSKDKMFHKYVKSPFITDGLRLDTVINPINGSFIYEYTQTIRTVPKLKSVRISMDGSIYEEGKIIYTIPQSEDLTFYISSLSTLVDDTPRYLNKVIERRATANTVCWIDFEAGKDQIREDLSNNRTEIIRIKKNLADILENREYDLDSIIVTASSSPEGSWKANKALAARRSKAASHYFESYVMQYLDSLEASGGFLVDESGRITKQKRSRISFRTREVAENWNLLDALVKDDRVMSAQDKERYFVLSETDDPDRRESRMKAEQSYRYLREKLYPRTRTVQLQMYLHRKDMVKDTIHTTILDSLYMQGVQAIKDRDYMKAIELIGHYRDYNSAVAYCSLDYNATALDILQGLPQTAEVMYMTALLLSRMSDHRSAVELYLRACEREPSLRFRGNLDPEISSLIKTYGLNENNDFE